MFVAQAVELPRGARMQGGGQPSLILLPSLSPVSGCRAQRPRG